MAFTLRIKRKSILGNKKVDFYKLLSNCHLNFGSNNEFYILEENRKNQKTAVLYNPDRIGRGIFYNENEANKGIIEVTYNIPTTEAEISDFINIVCEIESQMKKIDLYCVEEERKYTVKGLIENKEKMIQFSLESLHNFCSNPNYEHFILTLAKWPYFMETEQAEEFSACENLISFEQTLHEIQNEDVYYARPNLIHRKTDDKILAVYTLTEKCDSVFPLQADGFINFDNIKIDEGLIGFFIYSENQVRDGLFSYEKFINYMLEHGSEKFDKTHILIPRLTKMDIENVIKYIK